MSKAQADQLHSIASALDSLEVKGDPIKARPRCSADVAGGTVTVTAKIDPEDQAFLAELPEGLSYHVRQAVRAYVASLQES